MSHIEKNVTQRGGTTAVFCS